MSLYLKRVEFYKRGEIAITCLFDSRQACSVIRREWRWRVATLSVRSVDVYAELATTSEHLQFFNAISHSGLLKNIHGSWVEYQDVCVWGGSICIHISLWSLSYCL